MTKLEIMAQEYGRSFSTGDENGKGLASGFQAGFRAATTHCEDFQMAYRALERLTNIPCEASVYTLTDDEFGDICFARDLLDEILHMVHP